MVRTGGKVWHSLTAGKPRGQISLGALFALAGSAVGVVTFQTAGAGSWLPTVGAIGSIVGIFGFLLLAYRDMLKAVAKLEDEPARREAGDAELAAGRAEAIRTVQAQIADSIALLRDDLNRQLGGVLERIDGLEDRERKRLEAKAAGERRAS